MGFFRFIAPIGRTFGLMPQVRVFTKLELKNSLTDAGFKIDYQEWPGKCKTVFIVAIKAG
jgi:hypothetical protein